MTDIIFARPRHEYESYRDFWQLAKLSGFPVIFIDEVDPTDSSKTYIVSSPDASVEWPIEFPGARARIIYWMLEWYLDYVKPDGIDEVWHIDATFAQKIKAKFVPIGSHPELGIRPAFEYKWDVSHLMYLTGRRAGVVNQMKQDGLRIAPGGWGTVRDHYLSHSIAMLHVHQHENIPALAPLRAALAAAYRMPLISESHWPCPHIPDKAVITAPIEKLPIIVRSYCENGILNGTADYLHKTLCYEYQFGKVVRAAI